METTFIIINLNKETTKMENNEKTIETRLVLKEGYDEKTKKNTLTCITEAEFIDSHSKPVLVGGKWIPLGQVWLEWSGRRECIGIKFDSTGARIMEET